MSLCPTHQLPKTFHSIQALRALAALLVTLFHLTAKMDNVGIQSPLLDCFRAGFGGVDLFFIISGFIITHTSLSKFETPRQWLPYLKKRFIRIYSLYWILLLLASVSLLVFKLFTPSLQWVQYAFTPLNSLKATLLLPSHESPLLVTWTLSHELYFYLLFGCLIVSRFLLIIPATILGATVFSGLMTLLGHPYFFTFPLNDFFFSPFNLEFCLGIAAYFLVRSFNVRIPLLLLALAGLIFVQTGERINPADLWFRVGGFGLPATVFLLALIQWEKTGAIRYPAWLLRLGDASYMLYLIHMPVIMVGTHALLLLGLRDYVLATNFAFLISLIWFSSLAHQRIEKPLLHWLNHRPRAVFAFSYRLALLDLFRILVSKPSSTHKMLVR